MASICSVCLFVCTTEIFCYSNSRLQPGSKCGCFVLIIKWHCWVQSTFRAWNLGPTSWVQTGPYVQNKEPSQRQWIFIEDGLMSLLIYRYRDWERIGIGKEVLISVTRLDDFQSSWWQVLLQKLPKYLVTFWTFQAVFEVTTGQLSKKLGYFLF